MQEEQQQLVERLKQAQNVLVTVSNNPSVDQLAAAIGLTVTLNHLGKHATAVFSGRVPSTIEFLRPEETLEKNTDSLRDFIIALDKSKADKLRYKVEDQVVRIFITPYKTSISEKDLQFSQGDFNVDVVVALGVHAQSELDGAITAHGRILHDATVATINTEPNGDLGSMNWLDTNASSLSELVTGLVQALDKKVLDSQIATALLTGIVASTERFRNDRTTPKTMSISATLMTAGANQQLIATQLEPEEPHHTEDTDNGNPPAGSENGNQGEQKPDPGTLEIDHPNRPGEGESPFNVPFEPSPAPAEQESQVKVNEDGQLTSSEQAMLPPLPEINHVRGVSSDGLATEFNPTDGTHTTIQQPMQPPKVLEDHMAPGGAKPETDPTTDELIQPAVPTPVLSRDDTPPAAASPEPQLPPAAIPEQAAATLPPVQPEAPVPSQPFDAPSPATAPAFSQATPAPQPPASPFAQSPSAALPPSPFAAPAPAAPAPGVATPASPFIAPDETLSEIEQAVDSPHLKTESMPPAGEAPSVEDARNAVEAALNGLPDAGDTGVPAAFNALPLGNELHPAEPAPTPPASPLASTAAPDPGQPFTEPTPGNTPADEAMDMPLPQAPFGQSGPQQGQQSVNPFAVPQQAPPFPQPAYAGAPSAFPGAMPQGAPQGSNPNSPPPVPPPMLPPIQ